VNTSEGVDVDVEVDVFSCVGLHDLSLSRRQASHNDKALGVIWILDYRDYTLIWL
jgi:hypothetical protein